MPNKITNFARATLLGHIAFLQAVYAVPLFLLFAYLNYYRGELTLRWALWMLLVSSASGLVVAVLFWYTTTLPRMKKGK